MNLADLTVETVRERMCETGLSHAESLSKARQFIRAAEALVQMGADGSAGAYAHFVPGRIEVLGKHTDYAGGRSIVSAVERGFCMMIGGPTDAVSRLDPVFDALAPGIGTITRTLGRDGDPSGAERGYIHAGPAGAGHFVKMVHNGIEYGLMAAYAEGFDVLKTRNSDKLPEDERFDLNLTDIAEVWRRGSVISSWLLDLTAAALQGSHDLSQYSGMVADSGEGHWTIDAAMEEAVPVYVLSAALFARYRSRTNNTFGDKLLSAMRSGFGGHVEIPQ